MVVHDVQGYAAFMLDTEGRVTSWNEGAMRIKGYHEAEILGQHFSLFYPPEETIDEKPHDLLALATANGSIEQEGWRLRKDGSRFWAASVTSAIRDKTGELIGFSRVSHDLTDRGRAKEELGKTNERLEMILDSITDRFFAFDSEWRYTHFNKHAKRATEGARQESREPHRESVVGRIPKPACRGSVSSRDE